MSTEKMKRLGDAELEIMQVIWQAQKPVTSSFILEHLEGRRKWALSTLMTVLTRLADKGFLLCDRSTHNNLYSAVIAEQAYKASESRSFLEKLYGNSLQSLVANLYSSKAVKPEDLKELRTFLDELEKEE